MTSGFGLRLGATAALSIVGIGLGPLTVAQAPPSLPGSAAPVFERLAPLPDNHELLEGFVFAEPAQDAHGVSRPQRFPAGTRHLTLDVRLKRLPRAGMRLRYELVTTAGQVALEDAIASFVQLTTIDAASLQFPLTPKSGTFPPGPYRLTFWMDDVAVLAVNFTVGER